MHKGFDKHVCYWFVVVLTGIAAIIGGRLGLSLYSDSFIAAPKVDNPNTNPSSPDDRGKRHAFSPLTQDSSLPEHIFLQLLIKPRDVFGFNGEMSLSYFPDITCYRVSWAWNGSEHFRRANITTVKNLTYMATVTIKSHISSHISCWSRIEVNIWRQSANLSNHFSSPKKKSHKISCG